MLTTTTSYTNDLYLFHAKSYGPFFAGATGLVPPGLITELTIIELLDLLFIMDTETSFVETVSGTLHKHSTLYTVVL